MMRIPRGNPVIQNLNSSYLRIDRFIEHLSEEVVTGCIHLKSFSSEGALFFGEDSFLSGRFRSKKSQLKGEEAVEYIRKMAPESHFQVSVYRVSPGRVFYWDNIVNAKDLHKDLSSEFTDLESLLKKMNAEDLTGYIDVSLDESQGGSIYYLNGEIIEIHVSWERAGLKEDCAQLIARSRSQGGVFNVRQIPLGGKKSAPGTTPPPPREKEKAPVPESGTHQVIKAIHQLLFITENTVKNHGKIKQDFDVILKKKFVEKVSEFDFLDPFAAEFVYTPEKVIFTGIASDSMLLRGVAECVREIAVELSVYDSLRKNLTLWLEINAGRLSDAGIDF